MHRPNRYSLLIAFFLCTTFALNAQINLGVGYSLGYTNPVEDQMIFEKFNEDRPWLEDGLEPMNALQGFHMGLRYKFDFVALELTWRNRFRIKRANGIDPSTNADFQRRMVHRYYSYSIGIENFINNFSYGASIDLEDFAIRTEVTGIDKDFTIVRHYGLGSHFFVSYNLNAGEALSFAIRPYVHIPWQTYNIAKVAEEVNGDVSNSELNANYMNIGIMFIFYNGRK